MILLGIYTLYVIVDEHGKLKLLLYHNFINCLVLKSILEDAKYIEIWAHDHVLEISNQIIMRIIWKKSPPKKSLRKVCEFLKSHHKNIFRKSFYKKSLLEQKSPSNFLKSQRNKKKSTGDLKSHYKALMGRRINLINSHTAFIFSLKKDLRFLRAFSWRKEILRQSLKYRNTFFLLSRFPFILHSITIKSTKIKSKLCISNFPVVKI